MKKILILLWIWVKEKIIQDSKVVMMFKLHFKKIHFISSWGDFLLHVNVNFTLKKIWDYKNVIKHQNHGSVQENCPKKTCRGLEASLLALLLVFTSASNLRKCVLGLPGCSGAMEIQMFVVLLELGEKAYMAGGFSVRANMESGWMAFKNSECKLMELQILRITHIVHFILIHV